MNLSPRQMQCVAATLHFESRGRAAAYLGISERTLRNHLDMAFRKLEVNNIVGAGKKMGYVHVNGWEGIK